MNENEKQWAVWLETVQTGVLAHEQQALLGLLRAAEDNPDEPEALNHLALALCKIGRNEDAIGLFERLVQRYPDRYVYRISLATQYLHSMHFALARYHLEYVRDHASIQHFRDLAEQQLTGMISSLAQTQEPREYRVMQMAALLERIQSQDATPHDYVRLAEMYQRESSRSSEAEWVALAIAVLEQGHARFATDARVLECLINAYLPVDRIKADGAIRKLEKLDPHSRVLRRVSALGEDAERQHTELVGGRLDRADTSLQLDPHSRVLRRVSALGEDAERQHTELVGGRLDRADTSLHSHDQGEAPLEDWRLTVQQFPENTQCRLPLAGGTMNENEKQWSVWLETVQTGVLAHEQQALLGLLRAAEDNPEEPEALNYLALALCKIGRNEDAIGLFERLVQRYPDRYIYRISLATRYSQSMDFALAKYHLEHVRDHATIPFFRDLAEQQLTGMISFLGQTQEQREYRDMQIAALLEQIQGEDAKPRDYVSLAEIYQRESCRSSEAEWVALATAVLEQGHMRFANDARILECLVEAYLSVDRAKADRAIRKLEKLDPHSRVLRRVSALDEDAERHHTKLIGARLDRADANLHSQDQGLREAALEDLRLIVQQFPENPDCRLSLAWGYFIFQDFQRMLAEARLLACYGRRSHEFHFNLGQLLYFGGDSSNGREHLQIAAELARNDEQRAEVLQRLRDLENHSE